MFSDKILDNLKRLLNYYFFPHSDSVESDERKPGIRRIESAYSQALEPCLHAFFDGAIFALSGAFKALSRQVFAQDCPTRMFVAIFIVGADELPHSGPALVTVVICNKLVQTMMRL